MLNNVLLEKIILTDKTLQLILSGFEADYAWLENSNKHLPDIIDLKKIDKNAFSLSLDLLDEFNNVNFKLSISSESQRLKYSISSDIQTTKTTKFRLLIENDTLNIITNEKKIKESFVDSIFIKEIKFNKSQKLQQISTAKPIKTIVIGTCFSRSIFRSDSFFNPDYKDYFSVGYTAFHNSFISLMSKPVKDEAYLKMEDLLDNNVFKYIEVEFKKDLFETLGKVNPDIILIDNYIDATRPVIQITDDCFLTYNKYFSESIYKRKFSGLKIFYPGTKEHQELYRKAMENFRQELKKKNLNSQVILLGGRLAKQKKDKKTGLIESWTDKIAWINKSNFCWDIADSIFLEEIPEASYIDMRQTNWMSDIASPIIGGASPSHYESDYYREIFIDLKKQCFGENKNDL